MPSELRKTNDQTFEPLDDVDRRIVAELYGDARLRVAEIGRRVGLSAPAVAERLRRLTDSGTLRVHAEVEPRALGYTICAIVRVSPSTRDLRLIPDLARELDQVTECYRITGEDCYIVKLFLRSIDELEPILDRFTPLGRTTTSIVNAIPFPRRPLPVTRVEAGSARNPADSRRTSG